MRAYSRTSVSPRQPPCRTFASERLVRTVLRLVRSMVRTPSRSYCSHQRAMTSKQTVILFDFHHSSASSESSSSSSKGGGVLGLVSRRRKTKRTSRTPPRKRYQTVTSRTRSDREIWEVGARGESPRPSAFASSPFHPSSSSTSSSFSSHHHGIIIIIIIAKNSPTTKGFLRVFVGSKMFLYLKKALCASLYIVRSLSLIHI